MDKVLELVGGRSVINGVCPVYFFIKGSAELALLSANSDTSSFLLSQNCKEEKKIFSDYKTKKIHIYISSITVHCIVFSEQY